jgi:HEAT repeat protein
MTLFDKLFGGGKPTIASVQARIRREENVFNKKTEEALLALIAGDQSRELIAFLSSLAESGRYNELAFDALGRSGHPDAIEYLLDCIEDNRDSNMRRDKAVELFRLPQNSGAVQRLLDIALTSSNFHCVKAAVTALKSIETDQARAALQHFQNQPSRDCLWGRTSDIDEGSVRNTYQSTLVLKQKPRANELRKVEERLSGINVFLYGPDGGAGDMLRRFLSSPETETTLVWALSLFLRTERFSFDYRSTGDEALHVVHELVQACERSFPARKEEIGRLLATEDTSRLEVYLLNRIAAGFTSYLDLYEALPRRRDVSQLRGLAHPFKNEAEVRDYVRMFPIRAAERALDAAERALDRAREKPGDFDFQLKAFAEAYRVLGPERAPALVREFIEPRLKDPDWGVRKKALRALETMRRADAEPVLLAFLSGGETNSKLQRYAREALGRLKD